MENYLKVHKETYDALAEEYKSRDSKLFDVTNCAIDFFKKYLPEKSNVLELGCGSGLAARLMIKNGFKVTAIEISPKMIEVAKDDNPEVNFIEGDFLGYFFTKRFDAIFGMAFIHLFPKEDAIKVFEKCYELLEEVGLLYIGTTKSEDETEGWEEKKDYDNPQKRYRKHWTQEEFEKVLEHTNFEILELKLFSDPYGKTWMDYVLRKKR